MMQTVLREVHGQLVDVTLCPPGDAEPRVSTPERGERDRYQAGWHVDGPGCYWKRRLRSQDETARPKFTGGGGGNAR